MLWTRYSKIIIFDHMKKLILSFALVLGLATTQTAFAQCSMCTLNAENGAKNGNTQTKGINKGVLYLLAAPFVLAGGVGLVWYKKYKD